MQASLLQNLLYGLSALVSGFIIYYGLAVRRKVPQALEVTALAAATTLWILSTILMTNALTPALAGVGALGATLGATLTPPSFFLFVLRHTSQGNWLRGRRLLLTFAPTLFLLVLVLPLRLDQWALAVLSNPALPNPAYPLMLATNLFYGFAGAAVLARAYIDSVGPYRRSGAILVAAALLPILATLFSVVFGLDLLPGLDVPLLAVGLAAALFAWTVFRMRLLSFLPLAYPVLLHTLRDGVALLDVEEEVLLLNPAARHILGAPDTGALDVKFTTLLGLWSPAALAAWQRGEMDFKVDVDDTPARTFYQVHTTTIHDQAQHPLGKLTLFYDITDRVQAEQHLEQIANTDYLTGIHNRRHFIAQAEAELSRARRYQRPLCVVLLDADHFKRVNDTYGHQTGDEALKTIASTLNTHKRSSDLLGRYGGEEFALLLPETEAGEAAQMVERLRVLLASSQADPDLPELRVTASFGIACCTPGPGDTLSALLQRADQAMYQSKAAGRDRVTSWGIQQVQDVVNTMPADEIEPHDR